MYVVPSVGTYATSYFYPVSWKASREAKRAVPTPSNRSDSDLPLNGLGIQCFKINQLPIERAPDCGWLHRRRMYRPTSWSRIFGRSKEVLVGALHHGYLDQRGGFCLLRK